MNIEGTFEAETLRILRAIPGLTVTAEADRGQDATLRFAGNHAHVAVEVKGVKGRVSTATAWQVVHQIPNWPDLPLLLIASETTTEARTILGDHGIAVIDGLGNVHIEMPWRQRIYLAGGLAPRYLVGRLPDGERPPLHDPQDLRLPGQAREQGRVRLGVHAPELRGRTTRRRPCRSGERRGTPSAGDRGHQPSRRTVLRREPGRPERLRVLPRRAGRRRPEGQTATGSSWDHPRTPPGLQEWPA